MVVDALQNVKEGRSWVPARVLSGEMRRRVQVVQDSSWVGTRVMGRMVCEEGVQGVGEAESVVQSLSWRRKEADGGSMERRIFNGYYGMFGILFRFTVKRDSDDGRWWTLTRNRDANAATRSSRDVAHASSGKFPILINVVLRKIFEKLILLLPDNGSTVYGDVEKYQSLSGVT